jgi:addiction module HigA family antidote
MNEFIDIKLLESNPGQFRGKVKLVEWPDGKPCKHPSDFFKRNCLSRLGTMTNKEVAEHLGVTPKHLSRFLNEKVNIEPGFAVRLAKSTDFCVNTWLGLQRKYNAYIY